MKIVYTAHATATGGGRQGLSRTDDGHVTMTLATPVEMGGTGKGTNPEQLFATGYAACFLGAMRFAGNKFKITVPPDASVTASAGIGARDDGEGFGIEITMAVTLPGMSQEAAEDLAAKGHIVCPYSHSIKGNVKVTTTVTV